MSELVGKIARLLRAAEENHAPIPPLRDTFPELDIDTAYKVQAENIRYFGGRVIGRKIGLTARSVQTQLGVNQPDFGTLRASMCFGDGEEIPWPTLMQPKAEAEIAMVLGRSLREPGVTFAEAARSVEFCLPAIEVVGSRIANWNIKIVDTVADNASSGVFVLGDRPVKLEAFDPRMCGMVLEKHGEPVSTGAGAACLGHPLNALVWLANTMISVGEPLVAGDVILTGALGPMAAVGPGDVLEARIHGLGSVRAVFGTEAGSIAGRGRAS